MSLSQQTKELPFLLLAILIGALAGLGALGFLALLALPAQRWGHKFRTNRVLDGFLQGGINSVQGLLVQLPAHNLGDRVHLVRPPALI
jgi:hypothetical protein